MRFLCPLALQSKHDKSTITKSSSFEIIFSKTILRNDYPTTLFSQSSYPLFIFNVWWESISQMQNFAYICLDFT